MSVKELKRIQEELDKVKYLESEQVGKDTCGSYFYCGYCNKRNKYPCASAFKKCYKKENE